MPRPTRVLNPETVGKLLSALDNHATISDACAIAGIDRSTFYQWRKWGKAGEEPYKGIMEEVAAAQASKRQACVAKVATAEDWRAAAWYLQRSDPETWGDPGEKGKGQGGADVAAWIRKLSMLALGYIPREKQREFIERVKTLADDSAEA